MIPVERSQTLGDYWKEREDLEKMLMKAQDEVDRLRNLLRSLPPSIGITERDIIHEAVIGDYHDQTHE